MVNGNNGLLVHGARPALGRSNSARAAGRVATTGRTALRRGRAKPPVGFSLSFVFIHICVYIYIYIYVLYIYIDIYREIYIYIEREI